MMKTKDDGKKRNLLGELFCAAPVVFSVNYLMAVLDGSFGALTIICLQKIFDAVTGLPETSACLTECIRWILLFLMIGVLGEVANGIYNVLGEMHAMLAQRHFGRKIHQKISEIELLSFEDEKTLNYIEKSYQGAANARNYMNTFLTLLFSYVPYYGILGVYLYSLKPTLLLLLLFVFVPELISQMVRSRVHADMEEKTAPYRRRCSYFSTCIAGKDSFKETRMHGAFPYFKDCLKTSIEELNEILQRGFRKTQMSDLLMHLLTLLGYMGGICLIFVEMMQGRISIGVFGAVLCSLDSVFSMTEDMIDEAISYGMERKGKVDNLLRFFRLPAKRQGKETFEECGDIELEEVGFTYPNMQEEVIKGVTMKVCRGEILAIVGENGSGKTTLSKLIAGLYPAGRGTVKYAGKDVAVCNRYAFYRKVSAVFQNFGTYKLSLRDNIFLGDSRETEAAEEKVLDALKHVGVTVTPEVFPEGLDTVLSKEYGGVDLSGGEWQSIAIARAFYRQHELIILDEPTAAIDPIEEKRVYERFMELCRGKTAVLITHRLGSVKMADKIAVMSHGKIVGMGTHRELLEKCELYRRMWEQQAGQYR